MGLSDTADSLMRGLGLADPVLRIGVTGLSRAGKTVFITSLVANLMARGRMPQLQAAAEGRILAAWLQPQPDDDVARFAFEDHLAALTAPAPRWPASGPLPLPSLSRKRERNRTPVLIVLIVLNRTPKQRLI